MALVFWISVYLNSMTKGKFSTATFCCVQMGIFSYYIHICVYVRIYGTYVCSFISTSFAMRFNFYLEQDVLFCSLDTPECFVRLNALNQTFRYHLVSSDSHEPEDGKSSLMGKPASFLTLPNY